MSSMSDYKENYLQNEIRQLRASNGRLKYWGKELQINLETMKKALLAPENQAQISADNESMESPEMTQNMSNLGDPQQDFFDGEEFAGEEFADLGHLEGLYFTNIY